MGRSLPKRAVTKTLKEGFLSSSPSGTCHSVSIRLDPAHPGPCLPYPPDMQTPQGKRCTSEPHFLLPLPAIYHLWINLTRQKWSDLMIIVGPMGKAYVLTSVLYILWVAFLPGGEGKNSHSCWLYLRGKSKRFFVYLLSP